MDMRNASSRGTADDRPSGNPADTRRNPPFIAQPTPVTLNFRTFLIVFSVSAAYLLLSALLIGFKTDQLFLVGLFNVLFWISGMTRRFILGFSVFIVFWILFDSMKAFPNYRFNTVHIASIYHAEKTLFGIGGFTPNEFWQLHHTTFLDILSGIFYLCWIPLPLAFAGWLFYKDKKAFFCFALSFLLVNLLGFIVYYAYPAAPPWYVQLYGFDFNAHTPGNTAGLGRFDLFFHRPIFSSLYAKSSNVFAAMPSLHASYPLIVLYYGVRRTSLRFANILFAVIMVGIWFAAVYSSHHYVLDVLAGIGCGLTGITLFNYLYRNVGWFTRFVQACVNTIS
ncbi:MAG TPA: phosphatase PAP2 family protein [Puia sp.]|nr:phosphatase PAP2 family protein [Puia sp.]